MNTITKILTVARNNARSKFPYTLIPKFPKLPPTIRTARIYCNLALPLIPSAPLISKTLSGKMKNGEEELEDNITHLIILAKIALEKGDKDRAEGILEMGIKLCEDKDITFGLPYMYDIMVNIAVSDGDMDKAQKLLVTAIEKMSRHGSPENNHHILNFKLRLARLYSTFGDYMLAEIGFTNCLEAQKEKLLSGDVSTKSGLLYINMLFWYGIHKIRNKHFAGAKKLLDTAYDYSTKIKGLSPYQEMVILYTLADLNLELGEYDVALMNIQNAVMLGKGIGSTDLPLCYVKLAKIYMKMNVWEQAKNAAEEGVKLGKLFNHLEVVEDGQDLLKEIDLRII